MNVTAVIKIRNITHQANTFYESYIDLDFEATSFKSTSRLGQVNVLAGAKFTSSPEHSKSSHHGETKGTSYY